MLRGLLVPGRCAEICHHHGLVGTSTAGADNRTSGLPHKNPISTDDAPRVSGGMVDRR
jgi:hypothetical protein